MLLFGAAPQASGKPAGLCISAFCAMTEVENRATRAKAYAVWRIIVFLQFGSLRGHPAAALSAAAACVHAIPHISKLFAALRAGLANIGANAAHGFMMLRSKQHHIGGGLAGFSASQHKPEVVRLDMIAAGLQAVVRGHSETNGVAPQTFLNASLHVR